MGKPILYGHEMSSVVRSVFLVAKAIDLDYEYREMKLNSGEHMSDWYLKMNPQHTIPTLNDNGLYLAESHAIAPYLIQKYAKNDDLYPKNDLAKRAKIDQRMHFDNGILYGNCIRGIVMPIYRQNAETIDPAVIEDVNKAYEFMDKFLETDLYLVGNAMTVADLACVASISSLFVLVPADPEKFSKLLTWFKRMQALPYYKEANEEGNIKYIAMLRSLMGKKKE